jgi:TolB protein
MRRLLSSRFGRRWVVGFAVLVFAGVICAAALATFPGSNGRIAFRRYFNDNQSKSAIFTINANGSDERQITHPPSGSVEDQPDWSPDGSLLVFLRCNGSCAVYTVDADGTGLKRLSSPCKAGAIPPGCEDDANVSFLPDGKHVIFTRASGKIKKVPGGDQIQHSDLVTMDLNGQHRRRVLGSAPYAADYNFAAFAPSGKQFVYEHANSPLSKPVRTALFVANANGGGDHRITPWSLDGGDNPDWSPDGNWIVFRTHVRSDQNSQIALIHPNGSGLRQLTHFKPTANVRSACFSPDGKQIVVAGDNSKGTNPDVYVMNLDGSGLRAVTNNPLWDSAADWGAS